MPTCVDLCLSQFQWTCAEQPSPCSLLLSLSGCCCCCDWSARVPPIASRSSGMPPTQCEYPSSSVRGRASYRISYAESCMLEHDYRLSVAPTKSACRVALNRSIIPSGSHLIVYCYLCLASSRHHDWLFCRPGAAESAECCGCRDVGEPVNLSPAGHRLTR